MPSTRDLMNAISRGDLDSVQQVLTHRSPRGIPSVDINTGFGTAGTALLWALWCHPINELIMQTLLDVRDNANNPVCNINYLEPHGQTVLSFLLTQNIKPNLRRRLLQRVLDVRGANGELVTDITADGSGIPLLTQAVALEDSHCFRILQDTRTATGEFALDINKIYNGKTVLDWAVIYEMRYRRNQAMIQTIQQLGGLRAKDLPINARREQRQRGPQREHQQRREAIPGIGRQERRIAPPQANRQQPPINQAQIQVQEFNQNSQNTHDPSVTHTAKASLVALNCRYGKAINEKQLVSEVEELVENFDYNSMTIDKNLTQTQKKQSAKKFLKLLKDKFDFIHSATDLSIKRILTLVWSGVKDNNVEVYPEEIRKTFESHLTKSPNYLIDTKKSSLIEKFIEGEREYKENGDNFDICTGGSIHKLLESLNNAHIDVLIVTGQLSIKPAANAMATSLVDIEFRKKTADEQAPILADWNSDEDTKASQFKKDIIDPIKIKLKEHFGTLLTNRDIKEITDNVEYLPRPGVPHKNLNALVDKILNTVQKTGTNQRQSAIEKLHQHACNIYYEKKTDAEKYCTLSTEFRAFNQFDNFAKATLTVKEKYKGTSTIRLSSIQNIESFVACCYRSYAAGTTAEICRETFIKEISYIRDHVQNDHKQHGALRFFGRLQPVSRLVTAINQALYHMNRS